MLVVLLGHSRGTPGYYRGYSRGTPGYYRGYSRGTPGYYRGYSRGTPGYYRGYSRGTPGYYAIPQELGGNQQFLAGTGGAALAGYLL